MENMFNFFLRNVVLVDVRQSCRRIDVIPDLHAPILPCIGTPTKIGCTHNGFAAQPLRG